MSLPVLKNVTRTYPIATGLKAVHRYVFNAKGGIKKIIIDVKN